MNTAAHTKSGELRFGFGENWQRFRDEVGEARIVEAETSLKTSLGVMDLRGKRFLDIGSGSGLFSLAARRLGATVYSFDYDPDSVACTEALRDAYIPGDPEWTIERGSALDASYLQSLGKFDIVYSWGVLHHTGNMWQALENAVIPLSHTGRLFVSIYNDEGWMSEVWLKVKIAYNKLPPSLRFLVVWPSMIRLWGPPTVKDFVRGTPFRTWREYGKNGKRGMSAARDVTDWVGGYPFEVAKPDAIFAFFTKKGLTLTFMTTALDRGCNEFVFSRTAKTG